MRILHVTRDFPPQNSGGLSTAVGGLVEAQVAAGLECEVVSFDDYKPNTGTSVEREPQRSQSKTGIRIVHVRSSEALERAQELASKFVADVVHVHHESLWEFSAQVAAFHRVPTVYTAHVLQSEQDRLRSIPPTRSTNAQHKALAECSAIHAPSQAVASLLCQSSMPLASRLTMIPLGASLWPNETPSGNLEAASGYAPDRPPSVLYVGRFADINGFAQFLAALPPLFAQHPTLQAVAAGGLPGNERGVKRWEKRWKKMAGDQHQRLQMPGWLPPADLSQLYRQASVMVVPSWFETFGQVVLEGMLHNTPLITTRAGSIPELVDEHTALLIETKSAAAIVDAVNQALSAPEQARERAKRAREKAQEGYRWIDRMPEFLALYESFAH